MQIYLVKNLNGILIPAHDSDKDKLNKYKIGEMFLAEVKKPRNIKFHKKFFALINLVFENQSEFKSIDEMRYFLTLHSGYFDEVVDMITGEVYKKAKSISFSNMDEHEFSELYSSFVRVSCEWLKITEEQISDFIDQYF